MVLRSQRVPIVKLCSFLVIPYCTIVPFTLMTDTCILSVPKFLLYLVVWIKKSVEISKGLDVTPSTFEVIFLKMLKLCVCCILV